MSSSNDNLAPASQNRGTPADTSNPAEQEIARLIERRKEDAVGKTELNIATLCMYYPQFTMKDVLSMPLGDFQAYMRAIEERRLREVENALLTACCVMNPKGIKAANRRLEQARVRLRL